MARKRLVKLKIGLRLDDNLITLFVCRRFVAAVVLVFLVSVFVVVAFFLNFLWQHIR